MSPSQPGSFSISIRSSLFGSRSPPIPVARVVTVARVASPYSNDRAYQPFFLHALKAYFDNQKRLVKKGDLISVAIQPEVARLWHGREPEELSKQEHTDVPEDNVELLSCKSVFVLIILILFISQTVSLV
jgi:peroxin-6